MRYSAGISGDEYGAMEDGYDQGLRDAERRAAKQIAQLEGENEDLRLNLHVAIDMLQDIRAIAFDKDWDLASDQLAEIRRRFD